jgi:hypothetical protein
LLAEWESMYKDLLKDVDGAGAERSFSQQDHFMREIEVKLFIFNACASIKKDHLRL